MRLDVTANWTRRAHRAGGFTLIELLAVIVILAIMAGVSFGGLQQITDTRAAVAERDLIHDLGYARQRAVATGVVTWFVVDEPNDRWSIFAEDPANPGRASRLPVDDLATGAAMVTQLGKGAFSSVRVDGVDFDGDAEVGFDWLGRPLSIAGTPLAADGTVTLSEGKSVVVSILSGLPVEGP